METVASSPARPAPAPDDAAALPEGRYCPAHDPDEPRPDECVCGADAAEVVDDSEFAAAVGELAEAEYSWGEWERQDSEEYEGLVKVAVAARKHVLDLWAAQEAALAAAEARAGEASEALEIAVEMIDGLHDRAIRGVGDVPRAWVVDNLAAMLAALRPARDGEAEGRVMPSIPATFADVLAAWVMVAAARGVPIDGELQKALTDHGADVAAGLLLGGLQEITAQALRQATAERAGEASHA